MRMTTAQRVYRGEGQKYKNFQVTENNKQLYFTMSQSNPQQSISISVSAAELEVMLSNVKVCWVATLC